MDYKKEYSSKQISSDEAAMLVKSGDWVEFGVCSIVPQKVDKALARRLPMLEDVKFRGGILLDVPEIFKIKDPEEHFSWNSWHMSGIERKAQDMGFAYYAPIRFSELPRYYIENVKQVDVMVIQVTPMDKFGFFSFGISTCHYAAAIEVSDKVIVEVNENLPRCNCGRNSNVHISEVDYIVEGDNPPLRQMPSVEPDIVEANIARQIIPMIPDGACLQLGIGGLPNAVGKLLAESDLKDLGIHSEMYVDSYVELEQKGIVTGRKKNINKGVQVYSFAAGSQKLYDYLDMNPSCCSMSVDYVNDPRVIAQLDNVISINNAVDMDLYGQVNAESSGFRNISGAGGQLDFVLGAYLSKGGKTFICMSSAYVDKKTGELRSRIRPTMREGSAVTDTRANTQYVCTEYGCINLKGLSSWQRAEAIIGIAHPDFRESLIAEAEKMKIWRKSNRK